jgi:glycine cleavage system H protein
MVMSSLPTMQDSARLGSFLSVRTSPARSSGIEPWQPVSADYSFLGNAWAQAGVDGTLRVGTFPLRSEARLLKAVHLPRIGEALDSGAPLVSIHLLSGAVQVFAAPISGEVVEINESLKIDPNPLWHDPCHGGWVARVRPSKPLGDLWACSPRHVVLLANADEPLSRRVAHSWLTYYGCTVRMAPTLRAAVRELRQLPAEVLVIDASSIGGQGPHVVTQLRALLSGVRVLAVTMPGSKWESLYRARGVPCCSVDAVFDYDMAELLSVAFRRDDFAQA